MRWDTVKSLKTALSSAGQQGSSWPGAEPRGSAGRAFAPILPFSVFRAVEPEPLLPAFRSNEKSRGRFLWLSVM